MRTQQEIDLTQREIDRRAEALAVAREALDHAQTDLEMVLEALHNIRPGDIVRDTENDRLMVVHSLHFADYKSWPLVAEALVKNTWGKRKFWLGSKWEHVT